MSRHSHRAAGCRWPVLACAAAACCASACGKKPAPDASAVIVVRVPPGSGIDLDELTWSGPVRGARVRGPHERVLELAGSSSEVSIEHPRACPVPMAPDLGTDVAHEVTLAERLTATDQLQVGFAAEFELAAYVGCADYRQGASRFEWKQISGPKLEGLEPVAPGDVLRGRTHALEELRPGPVPWGIVPFSPATQGAYEFEVTWIGPGGLRATATARVTATARASGIPSVGLGHRILLGGKGWSIHKRPLNATAELKPNGQVTELIPDNVGGWELADQNKRSLLIRVGRYADTPLDCGRSECHPTATRDARATRMTNTFAFDCAGRFGDEDRLRCALACHTVGEPGVEDAGFTAVQAVLGVSLPARGDEGLWNRLPRALRRLGGVGCTGCHGPAAIPLPGVARTVLRIDVCAVCHDAPPRYGHVAAWRQTRMAKADADERTRQAPCARCHTTAGFLEWQDTEFLDWQKKSPAADAAHIEAGISCAACHDPHGGPTAARLVRNVRLATDSPGGADAAASPDAVCLPCHSPLEQPIGGKPTSAPAASAAWLFAGRGGLRVTTGETMTGPTQHAEVARGCVGCHRSGPEGVTVERGAGHGFRAGTTGCTEGSCHEDPGTVDGSAQVAAISARARKLLAELKLRLGVPPPAVTDDDPPHAGALRLSLVPELARAYYDVALVVEDPAAVYHNAAYARALLDEVEAWLRGAGDGSKP